jgi:Kef-type K+ transport system membrane component KefB
MTQPVPLILVAGLVVMAASLARRLCGRAGVQPLVGYMLVGLLIGAADDRLDLISGEVASHLDFLGQLGVIILLFKIGLESNLARLLGQLRRAVLIWVGNVTLAALLGFVTARYVLGFGLVPALFTAVALSATSVGVATAVWQQAGALDSDDGALVLDVAELDDISAIVLMVLLFASTPLLVAGTNNGLGQVMATELTAVTAKFAAFAASCYLFARYAERGFTGWFIGPRLPAAVVGVATTGLACVIAGVASWIGFSVAIGALFAGLAFSRDPAEFEIDRQLTPVFELLSPFFFVTLGLGFELSVATTALGLGSVLLVAAIAGKLLGAGLPAALVTDRRRGMLIGLSMVPRAEIAMLVMLQGLRMGEAYVPPELFSAMSLVALSTALLAPVPLAALLRRARAGAARAC